MVQIDTGIRKNLDKKILIIDNFLPNLEYYLNELHKIPLFEPNEFNLKFNSKQHFPGKRSNLLNIVNPFFFSLILQNLEKVSFLKKYSLDLYLHLRRKEDIDKDWIHQDITDYSFLIYLNETNSNSGTYFYDEGQKNLIADIKYVQNRFVIFNSSYNHMGYGHFGTTSENGRLTTNGFVTVDE